MKIVVPMLGRGSSFIQAGITTPKPLVQVHNRSIFAWSMSAISDFDVEQDGIFIVLRSHVKEHALDKEIRQVVGSKVNIVVVDQIPDGAAKTVLLAKKEIDNDEELMIYNTDQFFRPHIKKFLEEQDKEVDGVIPIFPATHPKWSYVETDENNRVVQTAEKQAISNKATVGLYYFKTGHDFVWAAEQMIGKQLAVGSEYYVCPVYNELIAAGKNIIAYPVKEMWSLGTPEDVEKFERFYKGDLVK
jgi:NDP-sugar pyrophosphorylase family protein